MKRLRTWNERFRTRDSKERNLKQALGEIDRMASALGLPENVRETASVIYRRALSENLLPGRSIEGVRDGVGVYAAARQAGTRGRSTRYRRSPASKMELTRTYRYIVRELKLEIQPRRPWKLRPRFISDLDLSRKVRGTPANSSRPPARTRVLSGKSRSDSQLLRCTPARC